MKPQDKGNPYDRFLASLTPARVVAMGLAALFFVSGFVVSAWALNSFEDIPKVRVLMRAHKGVSPQQWSHWIRQKRARHLKTLSALRVDVVEMPADEAMALLAERSRNPFIQYAEIDWLLPAQEVFTSDPQYPKQWHLPKIGADRAWEYSLGEGIVVAVVDTGVDASHEDLASQMVPGWNLYDNNNDTGDVYGHGTKVAGVVAAASNNGVGVSSVAWQSLIMPVRVSAPDGYAYLSTIAEGIRWAADHGARVVNVSYDASWSTTVQSAAAYMRNKGGLVVMSAGNSGTLSSTSPAADILCVAATTSSDTRASFSSYGNYVDLAAPGVNIWTTAANNTYGGYSGTSFSAPIIAGTASLVLAANPGLDPSDVESILKETAVDLGPSGFDIYFGAGRVDAGAAVFQAVSTWNFDAEPPSVSIVSPSEGTVSGLVHVEVNATDNKGVARVELYVGGQKIAEETVPPYAFMWDTTQYPDGSVSLEAHAVDHWGNEGVSSPVMVTVDNHPQPVNTPPSVTFLSPQNGATALSTEIIQIQAHDDGSVARLSLSINGKLTASTTKENLTYKWYTYRLPAGAYTLSATAEDNAGATTTSSIVVHVVH